LVNSLIHDHDEAVLKTEVGQLFWFAKLIARGALNGIWMFLSVSIVISEGSVYVMAHKICQVTCQIVKSMYIMLLRLTKHKWGCNYRSILLFQKYL
jgi:hypothetical protein